MRNKLLSRLTAFGLLLFASRSIAQPGNNNFASATLITTENNCTSGVSSFTGQTLISATADGGAIASSCTAVNAPDVWYKFVAKSAFPLISVTNIGASFQPNFKMQLLSGSTIPTLVENSCVNSTSGTSVFLTPAIALTIGTTYTIRVYKTTTGVVASGTWTFDICVTDGQRDGRMNEVFSQYILSGSGVLQYPWEITYGTNDDSLWITESRGYKLYKMSPVTGVKRTVLDLTNGSTWISQNTPGNPTALDSLASQNTGSTSNWTDATNGASGLWPQGGFAGMALHPQFGDGTHDYVYVSYIHRYLSTAGGNGGVFFRNKLVRFKYNSATGKCGSPQVLCDTLPGSSDHNSQRIIIAPVSGTNYLFYANGDMGAGQFGNNQRTEKAQMTNSYEGKILRFLLDSAGVHTWIPSDNPISATSAVYCTGIRNNQGFAFDASTNILYGASHGPFSDDEINIIQSGKNYGHPLVIGYSADGNYNGISPGSAPNMNPPAPSSLANISNEATNAATIGASYKDPLYSAYTQPAAGSGYSSMVNLWNNTTGANNVWPSEGWSGLDLYTNTMIPGWNRSLIAAGLKWGRLIKFKLDATGNAIDSSGSGTAHDTMTYFQSTNRYRDLAFGPNGKDIYVIMDNSSATSGPGIGNPIEPACAGCVIKYTFLGYLDNGSGKSTIDTSVKVTAGTLNATTTGNTITIDNTNKDSLWVPITGPDGRILAEIYPNGNQLGSVTSAIYNSSSIRQSNGVYYLNRNITITPQNQPASEVKIRLYISKAELDALVAQPGSGVSSISNLKILKNNDPISSTIQSSAVARTPISSFTGLFDSKGYVLEDTISHFSSFYFAGGLIVLPIDLLSFTGSLQTNNSALLNWKTAHEVNAAYFDVERSIDALNFTAIGRVTAVGNINTQDYSLVDNDASKQQSLIIYYRLKLVDKDGNFRYSNVISISLSGTRGKIRVLPNPVSDKATATLWPAADGMVKAELVDNMGRVVSVYSLQVRKDVVSSFTLNMSHLSAGIYILRASGTGMNNNVILQKQ